MKNELTQEQRTKIAIEEFSKLPLRLLVTCAIEQFREKQKDNRDNIHFKILDGKSNGRSYNCDIYVSWSDNIVTSK
jgi:hypothetical protein